MRWRSVLAFASALAACPAQAAPQGFSLAPESAQLAFRAYGLGVVPIDGAFTRFAGTLQLDPGDPAMCAVDITAEAASLQMPEASMTRDALGDDLLDATRHPSFAYRGVCRSGRLHGMLLLHGVTRPLTMEVSIVNGRWAATGRMQRADWGMGAHPMLAGPEVRLQIVAAIPPGFPNRP